MSRKVPIQPYEKPMTYKKYKRKNSLSPGAAVLFLVAIWYVLIGKDVLPQMVNNMQGVASKEVQEEKFYYEFPCSEANFARIIALTLGGEEVPLDQLDNSENELWYEKYYSILEDLGIESLKKEEAFDVLNGSKLHNVLQELFGKNTLGKDLERKEQLYLYEVIEAYDAALQTQNKSISYESLTILATPADEMQLEAWKLATDKGKFSFEGLVLDPLKNQTLSVAVWQDHLLGVMEIENTSGIIKECKIVKVTENEVTFEVAGMTFSYEQNQVIMQNSVGTIGQIELAGGKITNFMPETKQEVDTLVSISENEITLEKAGSFSYGQVNVYDQTDIGCYTSLEALPYGVKVAYTTQDGKITSLQVIGQSLINAIRVVLTSEGSYEQEKVELVGAADYDMIYEDRATTLEAGTNWSSQSFEWQSESSTVRFVPRTDSLLTISSIVKGESAPGYKGTIEITRTEKGYVIVNEVDLEDYVAGVIPSEMPTSYGIEALKAQAVAARTYAASSLSSSKFITYSAHVDDTTSSQVYNKIAPNDIAYKAAGTTAGLVLKSEDNFISNKFFASSCGYTANFGEVWAGQNFPSDSPSYLISRQQYLGDKLVNNLQQEENFKSFIKMTAEDMDAFDEDSPWFRWQVTLSEEELEDLIIPALNKLSNRYSSLITYESKAGIKTESPIEDLGKIVSLEAKERGQGGNLMTLGIYAENGNVMVSTEYLIRSLFASNEKQGLSVTRSNDSTVSQMTLLPSAFFTIEQTKDAQGNLESITLLGGGNGHGVGLSQDGAKGMAERGYTYKEILSHYYPEAELVDVKS